MPWMAFALYFDVTAAIRLFTDAHGVAHDLPRVLFYNMIACSIFLSTFRDLMFKEPSRPTVGYAAATFTGYKHDCFQTHVLRSGWASKARVLARIASGRRFYVECLAMWLPFTISAVSAFTFVENSMASNTTMFAATVQMAAIQATRHSSKSFSDMLSSSSTGLSFLFELSLSNPHLSVMAILYMLWGLYLCFIVRNTGRQTV